MTPVYYILFFVVVFSSGKIDAGCRKQMLPQLTHEILEKMERIDLTDVGEEPFLSIKGRGVLEIHSGQIYFRSEAAVAAGRWTPRNRVTRGRVVAGAKPFLYFTEEDRVLGQMRVPDKALAAIFVPSLQQNLFVITEKNVLQGRVKIRYPETASPETFEIRDPTIVFKCKTCGKSKFPMTFDAPSCPQCRSSRDPNESRARSYFGGAETDEDRFGRAVDIYRR